MMNPDEMADEEILIAAQATSDALTRLTNALLLVETVLDIDIEEFREMMAEEDSGLCVLCPGPAIVRDVLCIPWCELHRCRGEYINLMSSRRWPEVLHAEYEDEEGQVRIYSTARGAWYIVSDALCGSDERLLALACERSAA